MNQGQQNGTDSGPDRAKQGQIEAKQGHNEANRAKQGHNEANRAKQGQIEPNRAITYTCTHYPITHHLPITPGTPPPCTHHPAVIILTGRRYHARKVSTRLLTESTNTTYTLKHGLFHCFTGFRVSNNGPFSSAVTPGAALFLKWTSKTTVLTTDYGTLLVL